MKNTNWYSVFAIFSLVMGILGIALPLLFTFGIFALMGILSTVGELPLAEVFMGSYAIGFLIPPPFFVVAIALGGMTCASKTKVSPKRLSNGKLGLILGIISGVMTLIAVIITAFGILGTFLQSMPS